MRNLFALFIVGVVLVTACGGNGEQGAGDLGANTTTAPTEPGDDEDVPAATTIPGGESDEPADDGPNVSGLGLASITFEGETYHFGETSFPALRCDPDVFGVFWVILGQVDESGNEVPEGGMLQLVLLQEGTDESEVGQVPEATMELADADQTWVADPGDVEELQLDPGTSQVDDYTVSGNSASGTATFYEVNSYYAVQGGTADEVMVGQGTFEATCAG